MLKNIFLCTSSTVVGRIFGATQTFLLARILDPEGYGVWVTISLLLSYLPILSLGTVETLLRQVPFYRGKGNLDQLKRVEGNVLTTVLLAAGLGIAGSLTIGWLPFAGIINQHLNTFRLGLIAGAFGLIVAYFYHRSAAYEGFGIVSIIDLVRSATSFVLTLSFSLWFGIMGAIIGYLLHEIISCATAMWLNGRKFGVPCICWERRAIREAIVIGFPISVVWWLFSLQSGADRMVSASILGAKETGFYGLGCSISALLSIIPMAINRTIYPKINLHLGAGSDKEVIRKLTLGPAHAISIIMPIFQVAVLACLPIIFTVLLPKYSPGLNSARILVIGVFYMVTVRTAMNYLVANNKQLPLLLYVTTTIGINIALSILALNFNYGLMGLAISHVITLAIFTVVLWQRTFSCLRFDAYDQLQEIGLLIAPWATLIGILLTMWTFVPGFLQTKKPTMTLHFLIFLILYSFCILCVKRYRQDANEFSSYLKQKLKIHFNRKQSAEHCT